MKTLAFSLFLLISILSFGQSPKLYFNFGKNHQGSSPWNNANADPANGLTFSNLLDDGGFNTGIGVRLTTNYGGLYNAGATTGNNSGIVPDNVLREYYYFGIFGAPNEVRFKVTGLMPAASYNFKFVGSSTFRLAGVTDNGTTNYAIGSQSASLYVDGNTSNAAVINNVIIPSNGEVEVVMTKVGATPVGYINAMIIEMPSGIMYGPGNVSVSAGSSPTVSWDDNSNSETGYEIYRSDLIESTGYALIATTAANATSYVDSNVISGYTYRYKVRSKNNTNASGFSQEVETTIPVTMGGSAITVGRRVYVSFGRDYNGASPWNNTDKDPTPGSKFFFNDDQGNATGIYAELLTSFGGVYTDGAVTGNNSGVYPDNVLKEYYWWGAMGAPDAVSIRIGGLPESTVACNLKIHGGSVFRGMGITDNGHTVYRIGTTSTSLDVEGNTANVVTFSGVTANSKGEIILHGAKGTDALTGYINAMVIELPSGTIYAPSVFNADYVTGSGTHLQWNDANTSETGYKIFRKNVTELGSYSLLTTTSANATTHTDATVSTNQVYAYKIAAINGSVQSAYSKEVLVQTKPIKKIYVNFSQSSNAPAPWNNTTTNPVAPFSKNMTDEFGLNTGIQMSLTAWGGVNTPGATTGNNTGIVPDAVLNEFYWFGFAGAPNEETITLKGFRTGKTYDFKFVGSSVFRGGGVTDNGSTIYSIGSKADTLYVEGNTANWAEISDVAPDSQGQIQVTLRKLGYSPVGYINAMIIALPDGILYNPGSFAGVYVQNTGNQLSWTDNSSSETGFEIQRRNVTASGSYATVFTTATNATNWTDTGISEGNIYNYRIRSVSSTDASDWIAGNDIRSIPLKKVYVNFGGTQVAPSPWNNALGTPNASTVFSNLLDENNANSGINILLQTAWGGYYNEGAVTGNNSGVIPDAALKEYFWFGIFGAPNTEIVKIRGLDPAQQYNFKFLGSSVFTGGGPNNGSTVYTIGSTSVSLNVHNNTTDFAEFYDITPNSSGEVQVDLSKAAGAPAGYLNAMIIEVRKDQLYAPSGLNGTYVSGQGVVLSWDDNNTSETGYRVYRTLAADNNFQLLATVNANAETYTDNTTTIGNSYKYRLNAIKNSEVSANSDVVNIMAIPTKKVFFSFGKNYAAASPWNNAGMDPAQGLVFDNLVDEANNPVSVKVELLTAFGGVYDQGATTGNNSGIVPDNALKEYYYFGIFGAPNEVQVRVSGLTVGFNYKLSLVASSVFHQQGITDNGHTVFTINGITRDLYVEGNTSSAAVFHDVPTDSQGTINITIGKGPDATVGYINALILEVPDVPDVYYAIRDGNWTDNLWSHYKNATVGSVLPSDGKARIEGVNIVSTTNVFVQNLVLSAANGSPGTLTVNAGVLTNEGELKVMSDHPQNKIKLGGTGQIKVRPKGIRIMPIGNSITQGSSTTYSYRYALWKKLIDANMNFNFVGSQSMNDGGNPTFPPYRNQQFDTHNEGHWGKRADEILVGLPAWATAAKPDMVLVEAGTNDILQGQSVATTKEDLRGIIQAVREVNPNAVILLATIIPSLNNNMSAMASAITDLASEEDTSQSPVILVDQHSGFNATTDTYDGIHPNPQGEEKMAQKWASAILNHTP